MSASAALNLFVPFEEQVDDFEGILPSTKSTIEWQGWSLPGHGFERASCGEFGVKGCLNVEEHVYRIDVGDKYLGKAYIKKFQASCGRAECPICYEKWAAAEAIRATKRIAAFKCGNMKPIHVIVSPHPLGGDVLFEYDDLKAKALKVAKRVGILGGLTIFHPFRKNKQGARIFSPHFHIVGYGWVKSTKQLYEQTGWLVKNLGVRESVRATILYQLSHAGVFMKSLAPEAKGKKVTVTWFGALSYNKLKVPKDDNEGKEFCPLCDSPLSELYWVGPGPDPLENQPEGEYYIDPGGWREKRK